MTAIPPGMVISEADFDIVSNGLVALAQEAGKKNRTEIYSRLQRFVVRMRQHVYAGNGVEQELMDKMAKNVEAAFSAGDYERARQCLSAMLEAVVRMDPDPAQQIAVHLAPTLVKLTVSSSLANQQKIGAAFFRKLHQRFASDRKSFESDGWGTPQEVFDYVHANLDFMAAELEHGIDPFATEDDEAPPGDG